MFNFFNKMDWNFAKTQTLLYFYEYIIRKGEPQKVGNLSCLFGEKDFTNDMRGIVESSLAGENIKHDFSLFSFKQITIIRFFCHVLRTKFECVIQFF